MRFRILGPIRVDLDGREVELTASRDRVLLAMLLLHANQPVTTDRLIDAIWATSPPQNARNQLQGCVSRLRKRLSDGGFSGHLIVTEPTGYRAAVDPEDLDLLAFRRLVAEARAAAGVGRYDDARARFRAARADERPLVTVWDRSQQAIDIAATSREARLGALPPWL